MSRDLDEQTTVRWKDGQPRTADRRYGTKADPDPFHEATIKVPAFLRLEQWELAAVLNKIHCPLATRIYLLLLAGADFHSGSLTTTYKRFVALCAKPKPERGPRAEPPTYKAVRRAIEDLEAVGLVARDSAQNLCLQQLQLNVHPRAKPATKNARPDQNRAVNRAEVAARADRGKTAHRKRETGQTTGQGVH